MLSSIRSLSVFRNQYVFFISTIVVTVILNQAIVQYDLNEQNADARLINVAGRQRTLSQRIAKRVLYMRDDLQHHQPGQADIDTLRHLITQFETTHFNLLKGEYKPGEFYDRSETIDSLLKVNTTPLVAMVTATKELLAHPDYPVAQQTTETIAHHELSFLMTMEKTVNTFETEAVQKLGRIKKIELALAVLTVLVLLAEVLLLFRPMIRRLQSNISELHEVNQELSAANEELHANQEQIHTNLDQIVQLKEFLEASEKQHRELIEHATDMMYELDENGRFTYVNPVMENITEYSKEELLTKNYLDLVHPEHRENVRRFYKNQRSKRIESTYLELPMLTHNGFEVWIGQNARMFYREDGWVFKVSAVARDITVVYRASEALQSSEQLFRTLAEKAPVGIYQLDETGTVVFINNRWFEIVGLEREKASRDKRYAAIHPDDRESVLEIWSKAIAERKETNIEFRYQTQKGVTWVISRLSPIVTGDNHLTGFIGTMSDITLIKESEAALTEAKNKAEEATVAKSQFLSMMSHEIRTPMNAIIGLTNLLLQEKPRVDQLESLKLLKFSGENLLTIINDILDFSKIEAGKISLEKIDFDLEMLVRNTKQMLEQRARDKGIDLILKYDEAIPRVIKGDQVRLGQIITNLLGNAIKFTERGYVELSVLHLGIVDGKHKITFKVKDTGIGIEADKLNVIFESFSQARADTARKFGGTGLGLSITKRMLGLMGTSIEVDSKSGYGSTFFFTLLCEEGDADAIISKDVADLSDDFQLNAKVLLVEDNRVNQIVATNFLKKWGIEVEIANHGKEALSMIQNKSYQLVLMDLQMPEMDGYEASKRIRALDDQYFKKIPIIALTASAMIDIKEKVIEIGMTDFLSKPFHPEELQAMIARYVIQNGNNHGRINPLQASSRFQANLDLYSQGDPEFKRELAGLLIKGIEELRKSLEEALAQKQSDVFKKAAHKVKTTVSMLGDEEFTALVEKINTFFSEAIPKPVTPEVQGRFDRFHELCAVIIQGLHEEITSL